MDALTNKIETFKSKEPIAVGNLQAVMPFLKLIPPQKHRVLVIGCGRGHEVDWLQKQGFDAIGMTNSSREAQRARKQFQIKVIVADMHHIPIEKKYDAIFASNVLEHSVAPYLALKHWRGLLKAKGWLVLVMPSKEWLKEYYHFSVLTHSQTKDLLHKAGFRLLAGPETKLLIDLPQGSDIFYDLGRKWGHYDGYVAEKGPLPKTKFMKGQALATKDQTFGPAKIFKLLLKKPFNMIRIWYARHHRE